MINTNQYFQKLCIIKCSSIWGTLLISFRLPSGATWLRSVAYFSWAHTRAPTYYMQGRLVSVFLDYFSSFQEVNPYNKLVLHTTMIWTNTTANKLSVCRRSPSKCSSSFLGGSFLPSTSIQLVSFLLAAHRTHQFTSYWSSNGRLCLIL